MEKGGLLLRVALGRVSVFLSKTKAAPVPRHALARFSTANAAIPVSSVKQLRDMTGAPMMECKNALVESLGDVEKAAEHLRKKGLAIAGKKSGRDASQGLVAITVSEGSDTAAMIEFNSETDFVARNAQFQALTHAIGSTALVTLPASLGGSASSTATGLRAASADELAALALVKVPSGAHAGETIGAAVTGLIAVIRENMVLRRSVGPAAHCCFRTLLVTCTSTPHPRCLVATGLRLSRRPVAWLRRTFTTPWPPGWEPSASWCH